MAKKSKEIKFTQEELQSLEDLRNRYNGITSAFGNLEINRIQIENRLEQLDNEKVRLETQYNETIQLERRLVQDLTEKYGAGNLDINTGVFTPNN